MAIQHHLGEITTHDGLRLYQQSWYPEGEEGALHGSGRGSVVLVHGFAEHSDRYRTTAQFLVEQGLVVHSFDLRGHGRSEGDRAFVRRFEDYLKDLDLLMQRILDEGPERPVFLMGHSMGGAIATRYLLDYSQRQQQLQGLLLSAPALMVNDDVPDILLKLSALLSRFFPKLPTVDLDSSNISQDPDVVAAYQADPLVYHGKWLARTGAELVSTIGGIQANMAAIRLPLLLMHGTADAIVPAQASQLLYEQATSRDKTLKLYEGFYHEVLREPGRSQVLDDLRDWLQHHLAA